MKIQEKATTQADINDLVKNLRKADYEEVKAISGEESIKKSILEYSVSIFADDILCGVYGVVKAEGFGSPYLLCTDQIGKIAKTFLKESKARVKAMEDKFPILFNYIDSRNSLHLKFIKMCGFKIITDKMLNGVLFHGFIKEKEVKINV